MRCLTPLLLLSLLLFLLSLLPIAESIDRSKCPGVSQTHTFQPVPFRGKPVIRDNVIYHLNSPHYRLVPDKCTKPCDPQVDRFPFGVLITTNKALIKRDNPHIIEGNIEIAPSGCLYIEPGTILKFGAGYGIVVNGTLIARGSNDTNGNQSQWITFTKKSPDPPSRWPTNARLVDGNTTRDGRMELQYRNKWRGICTNYQNYTKIDANVTCRHLGFLQGNFTYHSYSRNTTDYIVYEKPGCKGHENSLFDCPGSGRITAGKHVCDGQEVIGFECAGFRPDLAKHYWRGIEFINSTNVLHDHFQNIHLNESVSMIEYAVIEYAGNDIARDASKGIRHPLASLSASPHPPVLNSVIIRYGAYDGINMTDIQGSIHIANSSINGNRGHGARIETASGRVLLNNTAFSENWGDGVKVYMSNYTWPNFLGMFPYSTSMEQAPIQAFPGYPMWEYQDVQMFPVDETPFFADRSTVKTYQTKLTQQITVHTLLLERDPAIRGSLEIRDESQYGKHLVTIDINNGSYPESVTTTRNQLWMKFSWGWRNSYYQCDVFDHCLRFLLQLTVTPESEMRMIDCNVSDNNAYGVNVQDMRNLVFFNRSVISNNNYGAGIRVYKGAGKVIINNTLVEKNSLSGVNITYSGGYMLINNSFIIGNRGYGIITDHMLVNKTRYEVKHEFEVVRSAFRLNEMIALRVGNYCRDATYMPDRLRIFVMINETDFVDNFDEAIEYLSCNRSGHVPKDMRELNIQFNTFSNNGKHAVLLKPFLNTKGMMSNNTFTGHKFAVFRVDNEYDLLVSRWYTNFPVDYNVEHNSFVGNTGLYVMSLRLTQGSPLQNLRVKFNQILGNNIQEAFQWIVPRSRAAAVMVLSSSNVVLERNNIQNRDSIREVSTHLIDPAAAISVKLNWWGTKNQTIIVEGIFDQDHRFNLAKIKYYPAMNAKKLYSDYFIDRDPKYRSKFLRGNKIGGLFRETHICCKNSLETTFYVDRDIIVDDRALLEFNPGTTLLFRPSVGMIVHSVVILKGNQNQKMHLTLDEDYVLPVENRTASVRLVDGADEYEGRLEVDMDGKMGTVCKHNWIEANAALVCNQLGLVYHPRYATLKRRISNWNSSIPVHMSDVACTDLDTDIALCTSNRDHGCTHDDDVFIRCQPLSWAGVVMSAHSKHSTRIHQITTIEHVIIEKAGLLDANLMSYTAGLRVDYNNFVLKALTVRNNAADGIHINFNNPFQESRLEECDVSSNRGNGIVTRSSFLDIFYTKSNYNHLAGVIFDPFFTEYDSLTIRNFIRRSRLIEITDPALSNRVSVTADQMKFLVAGSKKKEVHTTYYIEVAVESGRHVSLEILDYNPVSSVENVSIYDGPSGNLNNVHVWKIERDLVDFPIMSSSNVVTIKYTVKGIQSGRFTFIAHSRPFNDRVKEAKLYLRNCTFDGNNQGIVTRHYNNPSNRRNELYFRHKKEIFDYRKVNIYNSKAEAIHVPSVTKFHDDYVPTFEEMTQPQRLAEVTYNITDSRFLNNKIGLFAEHNHVDFANNVWQWDISKCVFKRNSAGGIEIEMPRINEDLDKTSVQKHHAVFVNDTEMADNQDFAFTIAGYYANVSILRNTFRNNKCLLGLMSISGMEKALNIKGNAFDSNEAMYVVDLDMSSHSEFSNLVTGVFSMNSLRNNYPPHSATVGNTYRPAAYAVALRGIELIDANHNVFENKYAFEMIAGIMSLSLSYKIDVKYNWWGTRDQDAIQDKIVDFDDWNNYAIAEYAPFLTEADTRITASVSRQLQRGRKYDFPYVGGRILKSTTYPARSTPYIVTSDLTVMPGAILKLEPGTVLEFYPNVGLLVLGVLEAEGYIYERITFRPATMIAHAIPTRQKRSTAPDIRLRNSPKMSSKPNEGFLEMYNSSTRSHSLMCDEQFNEKTAEVVCRQLGYETVNVKVRHTHLYDHYVHGRPMFFRKEFWYYSYYCRGSENGLDQCAKRINYNLLQCVQNANYTYVVCGDRNLDKKYQYWGNLRFAPDSYEETQLTLRLQRDRKFSKLKNVDIFGAGFLHGEKVGAIQATYNLPATKNVNITNCASNGIDYIAPRTDFNASLLNVSHNLGYAINVLVLNSESELDSNANQPLHESTIPYNILGMVPICKMEKSLEFSQRIIIYFKYSHRSIDCLKTIASRSSQKQIALRLLQINLFYETFSRNVLEIFDGKEHHEITAHSDRSMILRTYKSFGNSLTIHMHATPAHWTYGFIAEVVTLPISPSTYPDDRFKHVITNNVLSNNGEGAIQYQSVGEVSPSVYIEKCLIENNGIGILNLTSLPTIVLRVQGTRVLTFTNSYVASNKGVMLMNLRKLHGITLRANVTNNVFAFNSHGETLNITGHYAQEALVYENDIRNNTAGDWHSVINVEGVSVNFTYNILRNNVGTYILSAYNRDDVANVFQYYTKNGFIDNNSTAEFRATVFAAKKQTLIHENFFLNPASSFELLAGRRAVTYQRGVINATDNWWGKKEIPYIRGSIKDSFDDPQLLPVLYHPAKTSTSFFQEDRCRPGWRHKDGRCYRYIGAALPFERAKAYCKEIGGFLADSSRVEKFLHYLVYMVQSNPQHDYRIWVLGTVRAGRCSSFNDGFVIEQEDCLRLMLPFICDSDPVSAEDEPASIAMALGLGIAAGCIIFFIAIIVLILVCIKSKRRKQERMERQDVIRSSIRSARSQSLITGLSKSKNGSVESYLADPRNIHMSQMTNTDAGTDPMKRNYRDHDFSPDDTMSSRWDSKLVRPGRERRFDNTAYVESNSDEKHDDYSDEDEDEKYNRDMESDHSDGDRSDGESEAESEAPTVTVPPPVTRPLHPTRPPLPAHPPHANRPRVTANKPPGDSPPPGYQDSPRPSPFPRHMDPQRPLTQHRNPQQHRNPHGVENEIASLHMSPSREQVLFSNSSMDDRSIDMGSVGSRSQHSLDKPLSVYPEANGDASPRYLPQNSTFQSRPRPPPRTTFPTPIQNPPNSLHQSNPNLLQNTVLSYNQPPAYRSQPDLLSNYDTSPYHSRRQLAQPPSYEESERSPTYNTISDPFGALNDTYTSDPYASADPYSDSDHQRHPYYESPPSSTNPQQPIVAPASLSPAPRPVVLSRPPNSRRHNLSVQPAMETEI